MAICEYDVIVNSFPYWNFYFLYIFFNTKENYEHKITDLKQENTFVIIRNCGKSFVLCCFNNEIHKLCSPYLL